MLAHVLLAIEHLAHGRVNSAMDDLLSIKGVVFWDAPPDSVETALSEVNRG